MKQAKIVAKVNPSCFFQRRNTVFIELAGGYKDKFKQIWYVHNRCLQDGEDSITSNPIYFTKNQAIDIVSKLPNMDINKCWKDMSIVLKLPNDSFPRQNLLQLHAVIKFNCEHKDFKETDAGYCIRNMRNGKCPYQFAHMLFPNAYKNKESLER